MMFEMTQRSEADKYHERKVHRAWVVGWLQAWPSRKGSYCATYFAYVVRKGRTTDEHNSQNHANAFQSNTTSHSCPKSERVNR